MEQEIYATYDEAVELMLGVGEDGVGGIEKGRLSVT